MKSAETLADYLKPPYNYYVKIACATGLRVSDVLKLKVKQLKQKHYYVKEEKTGKKKEVYVPKKLREDMARYAIRKGYTDNDFFFKSPRKPDKHITRQTIFKQIKKASLLAKISGNIAPHSCRKYYANKVYKKKSKNIQKVQKALNHSNPTETLIYLFDNEE